VQNIVGVGNIKYINPSLLIKEADFEAHYNINCNIDQVISTGTVDMNNLPNSFLNIVKSFANSCLSGKIFKATVVSPNDKTLTFEKSQTDYFVSEDTVFKPFEIGLIDIFKDKGCVNESDLLEHVINLEHGFADITADDVVGKEVIDIIINNQSGF
jgi:hypothetical protein